MHQMRYELLWPNSFELAFNMIARQTKLQNFQCRLVYTEPLLAKKRLFEMSLSDNPKKYVQ